MALQPMYTGRRPSRRWRPGSQRCAPIPASV